MYGTMGRVCVGHTVWLSLIGFSRVYIRVWSGLVGSDRFWSGLIGSDRV